MSKLDKLERDSFEAKKELNRLATEWAVFRLTHGEAGVLAAMNGGAGAELLTTKTAAAAKYREATLKLADARLAQTKSGRAVAV
jgi:hypothetical protein